MQNNVMIKDVRLYADSAFKLFTSLLYKYRFIAEKLQGEFKKYKFNTECTASRLTFFNIFGDRGNTKEKKLTKCTRVKNSNFFTNPSSHEVLLFLTFFFEACRINMSFVHIMIIIISQRFCKTLPWQQFATAILKMWMDFVK